jgi:hypothetical protein
MLNLQITIRLEAISNLSKTYRANNNKQNIRDALPKNMAEPEKESYLYWETRKRMMAK